jgi:hypothetical protein
LTLEIFPQTRAFEFKGKLAIVNPQRRIGYAAPVREYSFTLDHRQGVGVCAVETNVIQGSLVVPQGGTPQDDSGRLRTRASASTLGNSLLLISVRPNLTSFRRSP